MDDNVGGDLFSKLTRSACTGTGSAVEGRGVEAQKDLLKKSVIFFPFLVTY